MRVFTPNDIGMNDWIFVSEYNETLGRGGEHYHDFVEIKYILSGKGMHVVNDIAFDVNAGDIFIVNPSAHHAFITTLAEPIIVYNCVFFLYDFFGKNTGFEGFFKAAKNLYENNFSNASSMRLWDEEMEVRRILKQLKKEFLGQAYSKNTMMMGLFLELLSELARLYSRQSESALKPDISVENVYNVIEYIDKNYDKNISLDELAKIIFVSNSHLCRIFRKTTGSTITQYIQRIKVHHASRELRETNKSFGEISYELGYKGEKAFRRIFKAHTGKNPMEYKKSAKN